MPYVSLVNNPMILFIKRHSITGSGINSFE
jgi:hypothetical protein